MQVARSLFFSKNPLKGSRLAVFVERTIYVIELSAISSQKAKDYLVQSRHGQRRTSDFDLYNMSRYDAFLAAGNEPDLGKEVRRKIMEIRGKLHLPFPTLYTNWHVSELA